MSASAHVERGFFNTSLRWLVFLPVGFLGLFILQGLPILLIDLARAYRPDFNFFTIVLALFVLSIAGTLAWLWMLGVYAIPMLCCKGIAPAPQVAAVIFATLFTLFQGIYLVHVVFSPEHSWISVIYNLVFLGLVIAGTVAAHKSED